jgi:hypothetical protein
MLITLLKVTDENEDVFWVESTGASASDAKEVQDAFGANCQIKYYAATPVETSTDTEGN